MYVLYQVQGYDPEYENTAEFHIQLKYGARRILSNVFSLNGSGACR